MKYKKFLLPALLSHALAAFAQSAPEEPGGAGEPQLETVTATARRSIEQRFFASGSLVVVDRRDIEQLGAFSVADVLRQLPGVQVTTGGDGSVEIRMRGMDRNATQLLIDGQRAGGGGRSQLPIDQLPSELIERIEVVRAPSAEYSGASGGTLNIVLRQASVKRETIIRLTDNHVWGRNAGQAFFSRTGPLGGKAQDPKALPRDADVPDQPWSYFVAASSIGYLLGSDTHRETSTGGAASSLSDASGRYRRTEVSLVPRLNGRLGPSDQLALRATVSRSKFSGDYASLGTGSGATSYETRADESQTYDRRYLQAGADWTHRFAASKLETTLNASQARDDVSRNGAVSQAGGAVPPAYSYAFRDDRKEDFMSVSTKLTGTQNPLLWSVGALAEQRSLGVNTQASSTAGALPPNLNLEADLKRQVVWGQNEWEVLTDATLTAGLRVESLTIVSSNAALLARRQSSFLQPSLHLRKPLSETLQFRANLARVTRNPRVWDLVDRAIPSQGGNSISNPDTRGNPNLRPEVAWTLDTGFERLLRKEGQSQGQVGLNLFVRQLKDTLASVTTLTGGRWVEQRSNVGDATVWGLEADAKTGMTWAGLGRDWTLSANASLLQSRMGSGINQGQRIPGQARYLANATVAKPIRRTGGWFGGATLSITGPADRNTSPGITGRDAARAALDVYAGSVVPGWGYWRVGIFNIGDAPYDRERNYLDASGAQVQNRSSMRLTPRLYLTVGTQF
ncbi:MAG: TonB-dependent receptor [Pseudomonadota bacterium]